jgi:RNA polymerase sigma-70 factor (ECF subfamily)
MRDVADLYRRHAGDLLRFARSLTGEPSLAEDAVAETFARVLDGPPLPEGVGARPWLFGMARHVCLDLHRRRRDHAPVEAAAHAAAGTPDPEAGTAARDALAGVLADLAGLPEEARAALLLRVQEGLSYDEIGQALGIGAGAARVRVHRARADLARRRIQREEQPWR